MAVFNIHVELADDEFVWWADTPAVEGLSIAASSLMELRRLIDEAAAANLPDSSEVQLRLAIPELPPANPVAPTVDRLPAAPVSLAGTAGTTFLVHAA